MELLFTSANIVQYLAISLGVGASTLAIINFFWAIADGYIDETERNMMGLVYYVLRVAMLLIFLSTTAIGLMVYFATDVHHFSPFLFSVWTLIGALYVNALLMTWHMIPSTTGPALQVATWHTLGFITSLRILDLTDFTYLQFILSFLAVIALCVALANGMMAYLRMRKGEQWFIEG